MARIQATKPALEWPRPQLEIKDLELVLALSVAGSTAAAAGSLHLTQSAVSRALAQAEDRVGARLFERSPRGLSPTKAGERLLAGAVSILQQLHELERAVVQPAGEPVSLRLVCECYTAYRWLPSAMSELRESWAELAVDVLAEHTADPTSALTRGKVDVALLTTSALPRSAELRVEPLLSDEVVLVLSRRHRLAQQRHITPLELSREPLITGNTPLEEKRWFLRKAFGRKRPKLSFLRFPLTEAVVDAARAGMGIAVLSEWIASTYLERSDSDLVVRRLSTGPLRRPWRIAYRAEHAHVAARLKSALQGSAPRLRVVS